MPIRLGIFARTYQRDDLDSVLEAVQSDGFDCIQFNLSCAGLSSLPERLGESSCRSIRAALTRHGIAMVAISGTFNVIHPDITIRSDGIRRCCGLIAEARSLGTDLVTLCTGSRDPENMWRTHPDNRTPEAWSDMLQTLEQLVVQAELHNVQLGIEPETANVIDSAARARRLIDELRSPALKVVMDPANLFIGDDHADMPSVLASAFDQLGNDIVLGHAKDTPSPGKGKLDFHQYLTLLSSIGFVGPLVLHNLSEADVHASTVFLRNILDSLELA